MNTKIKITLLVLVISLAFTACGGSSKRDKNIENQTEEISQDNATSGIEKPETKVITYPSITLSDSAWVIQEMIGRRLKGEYDLEGFKVNSSDLKIEVGLAYFEGSRGCQNLGDVDRAMMKAYPEAVKLTDITKIGKYDAVCYSCLGFLEKEIGDEHTKRYSLVGFFIPDVKEYSDEGKPTLTKIDVIYTMENTHRIDVDALERTGVMDVMKKSICGSMSKFNFCRKINFDKNRLI